MINNSSMRPIGRRLTVVAGDIGMQLRAEATELAAPGERLPPVRQLARDVGMAEPPRPR